MTAKVPGERADHHYGRPLTLQDGINITKCVVQMQGVLLSMGRTLPSQHQRDVLAGLERVTEAINEALQGLEKTGEK
jgi:hypothetical protein